MKRFLVPVLLMGCLVAGVAVAKDMAKPAKASASRYMIMVPHTPEECMTALDDFDASKSLAKFDFGCNDNDHTAYAIVTAKSADDAKMMVPEKEREKAKVVQLHKYTASELKEIHASMQKQ